MDLDASGNRPTNLEPRPELRPLLPPSIPDPVAYYFFNDGSGKYLKETIQNDQMAGEVVHWVPHNTNADHGSSDENRYPGPNWQGDDYFVARPCTRTTSSTSTSSPRTSCSARTMCRG